MQGKRPNRHSIRLQGFDYRQEGAYFVTICSFKRQHIFGEVANSGVSLSRIGELVVEEWLKTVVLRPYVGLDEFTVMPNHFHGILWLRQSETGTARHAPGVEQFGKPVTGSLPTIIRAFKGAVTKRIKTLEKSNESQVWQKGYYEHVIRNDDSLRRIREYITNNASQWDLDRENPERQGEDQFYRWLARFKDRPDNKISIKA